MGNRQPTIALSRFGGLQAGSFVCSLVPVHSLSFLSGVTTVGLMSFPMHQPLCTVGERRISVSPFPWCLLVTDNMGVPQFGGPTN